MTYLELYFNGAKSEVVNLHEKLLENMIVEKSKDIFALIRSQPSEKGWNVIKIEEDYERLKFPESDKFKSVSNSNFKLSPTYPSAFYVPATLSDDDLKKITKFRTKARVPAAIWFNHKTNVVFVRSSQPGSGLTNRHIPEDRDLLDIYRKMPASNSSEVISRNSDNIPFYIYDARKIAAAAGNRTRGGGYEDDYYYNVKYNFLNIENIHTMRESFVKMGNSLNSDDFYKGLSDSKWLNHVSSVLVGSVKIVNTLINEECSVLTHCSDGWDRTAQLSATSEFLLDPFYRTFKGFALVIEKEFCNFGFKFNDRCGHGKKWPSNEWSPIFIQWLDVIHQIQLQFPDEIEFNEDFLCFIAENIHNCLYGNFLYNTAKDRMEHDLYI